MGASLLALAKSIYYSNFNWMIEAIIGANFNIKRGNCFFSVYTDYTPDLMLNLVNLFRRFYIEKATLNGWELPFSSSGIQAQKLYVKRVALMRCRTKVNCLFVYFFLCLSFASRIGLYQEMYHIGKWLVTGIER